MHVGHSKRIYVHTYFHSVKFSSSEAKPLTNDHPFESPWIQLFIYHEGERVPSLTTFKIWPEGLPSMVALP